MKEFIVSIWPKKLDEDSKAGSWLVYLIKPGLKCIAEFPFKNEEESFLSNAMAHDYCSFLNEKYIDKEINEEWGKPDRQKRLIYHLEQAILCAGDKDLFFNSEGNKIQTRND